MSKETPTIDARIEKLETELMCALVEKQKQNTTLCKKSVFRRNTVLGRIELEYRIEDNHLLELRKSKATNL